MDAASAQTPTSPAKSRPDLVWGLLLIACTLAGYAVLAYARHSGHLIWDEMRYLDYAVRLNAGRYVDDSNPDFINGPGYPILLMPFADGPEGWRWARLLNALFMAGAVGFTWLTARRYAHPALGLVAGLFVALHPTLVWMSFAIMTEPLALFCLTGFMWSFCSAHRSPGRAWGWLILAAVFLGWLTLTRVFFGHVMTATAVFCGIAWFVLKGWRPWFARTLWICAGAFALCIPYLLYTWQKTGHIMTWSTNSGELLYWLTSTHPGENGHWFSDQDALHDPHLAANHRAYFERVMTLPVLERESAFKEAAIAHLKANPKGVFYNWLCNFPRMLFGFPRSFQPEELRTVVLVSFNGPLALASFAAAAIGLWRWRSVPREIWLLLVFSGFYLGGSTLAPALPRYFVLSVPVMVVAAAAILDRSFAFRLRPRTDESPGSAMPNQHENTPAAAPLDIGDRST